MSDNVRQASVRSSVQPSHGHRTGTGKSGPGCGLALVIMLVVYVIAFGVTGGFGLTSDDAEFYGDESDRYSEYGRYSGQPIPRFSAEDSRRLSQALSGAEERYGICFGWQLTDGGKDADPSYSSGSARQSEPDPPSSFDRGSSRGPSTPADTCPRWVELQVTVAYTTGSSERWSGVDLEVVGSPDFESYELPYDNDDFAALGIDAETFIDQPVATTGHAALALPLLMTENGALEPKPVQATPGEPRQPLPPAGSGMSGSGTWVWASVLGLVAAAAALLGLRARRKSGAAAAPGPPVPPHGPAGPPPGGSPQWSPPGPSPGGPPWPPQNLSPPGPPPRPPGPPGPPHR